MLLSLNFATTFCAILRFIVIVDIQVRVCLGRSVRASSLPRAATSPAALAHASAAASLAPASPHPSAHPAAHAHAPAGHRGLPERRGLALDRARCAGHAGVTGDIRLVRGTELPRLELLDHVSHQAAAPDDHVDTDRGEGLMRIGAAIPGQDRCHALLSH